MFPQFWVKAHRFFFNTSMEFPPFIPFSMHQGLWCPEWHSGGHGESADHGLRTKRCLQTSTRLQHCISGISHSQPVDGGIENSWHPLTGPNLGGQGSKYQWWPAHVGKNPRLCLQLWQAAGSSLLFGMKFRAILWRIWSGSVQSLPTLGTTSSQKRWIIGTPRDPHLMKIVGRGVDAFGWPIVESQQPQCYICHIFQRFQWDLDLA